jgi:hypothetical protein
MAVDDGLRVLEECIGDRISPITYFYHYSSDLSALIGMWPRRGVSGAEHALVRSAHLACKALCCYCHFATSIVRGSRVRGAGPHSVARAVVHCVVAVVVSVRLGV